MKLISVTITNSLTSRLFMFALAIPSELTTEQIECLYEQFREMNPDCCVQFDGDNIYISRMPVNMKRDEAVLTVDQFIAKWYRKTSFADNAKNATGTSNDIITEALTCLNLN